MSTDDMQSGSIMHFHARMGHLSLETIERMEKTPGLGITITNHTRTVCNSCKEGKQTKNKQSRADTGKNAPIDRVDRVICSDLKGPLTPRDRLGNCYLANFVDHKSNYCRVFLAPTKDKAEKRFEDFVLFFERMFECKIHILRTDGGGGYKNVDLFCQLTGIARQISEARNQASNGKAERMHRRYLTRHAA
uniref:Integrase catalytic domain-containing protein n=1 Tax=Peronospora matthiolae TaxID=2874970 RepID=A0AAV1TD71_9STRA